MEEQLASTRHAHTGPSTKVLAPQHLANGLPNTQSCCSIRATQHHNSHNQMQSNRTPAPAPYPTPTPTLGAPSLRPPIRAEPQSWLLPPCSCASFRIPYSSGRFVGPQPHLCPRLHPTWPRLLVLLALLAFSSLLSPAASKASSSSSSSSFISTTGIQLWLELDLRQLQQAIASTGFVGDTNSRNTSSLDRAATESTTITTTITTTNTMATASNAIIAPQLSSSSSSSSFSTTTSTTKNPTTTSQLTDRDSPSYELSGNPAELTGCLNSHQPDIKGTSWADAIHDHPTYFKVVGMWWSRKRADVPVTITTQLSWNRKWQLKAMCRSWAGPIAAVMHMPVLLPRLTRSRDAVLGDVSNVTLQRAVDTVAAFHARLDAAQPCKLDLMLLAEPYRDGKSLVLYPVNTLRNYARLMARTPLIGLVDVDLIVSSNMHAELLNTSTAAHYLAAARQATAMAAAGNVGPRFSTGASRLEGVLEPISEQLNLTAARSARGPRAAWVLPAFVTRGGSVSMQVERAEKLAAAGDKKMLLPYYKHGKVLRFDWGSTGHQNTDYGRWFSTAEPYIVEWYDRYEPWVIVDRLSSAWADMRFRGYGKNKISHIRTLAYDGYELRVHPSAFLIHRPHLESSSSNAHMRGALYGKKTKTTSMYGHNVYLYNMIKLSMAYGNYTPVVDPATEVCRDKLSWWQQRPKADKGGGNYQ